MMKVTVAFGDIKVVVPCGNGDITIRQLSELAITRYKKSVQQEIILSTMLVNITSLTLARDNGILDWDDKVSDVLDDRELIIAKFQNSFCSNNISCTSLNISPVGAIVTASSNHYFSPDRKNCLPIISSAVLSVGDENICSDSVLTAMSDSIENQCNSRCWKNGSSFISASSDVSSPFGISAYGSCDKQVSDKLKKFRSLQCGNKDGLSIEETEPAIWPVPPPLIATSEECTQTNVSLVDNICTPLSLPTEKSAFNELNMTKRNSLRNTTKSTNKSSTQTTSSMSSIPSNTDAKSLPQSFYSSQESVAVSDINHSSSDDVLMNNVPDSSKVNSAYGSDERSSDWKHVKQNSDIKMTNEMGLVDVVQIAETSNDPSAECLRCELSDIPEEDSSNLSHSVQNTVESHKSLLVCDNDQSFGLTQNLKLPPPMPPLRSAFTKLTTNSNTIPYGFRPVNESDISLSKDTFPVTKLKNLNTFNRNLETASKSSKSEHSIPSLFESDGQIQDDLDYDWSISGRSGDLESLATTTETSLQTVTTTTTTHSNKASNLNVGNYTFTVTLKKSQTGFGFSLTSRQNPVDLTNPVYVSKVLENGPALIDGRMKAGDRIITLNDEDVSRLSQKSIKEILLNISVDSSVKIGLCRPTSDSIYNILCNSNTSTSQKKSSMLNHTGDEEKTDSNEISVEEQKPVSFPLCSCTYKQSQPCCKLNLYHYVIPLKASKSEYLSPQIIDRSSPDTTIRSPFLKIQSFENRCEPPAIPLHHQNKLSPTSYTSKSQPSNKVPTATLGISVRRGVSQMSYNEAHANCQNGCQLKTSSKQVDQETMNTFQSNNSYTNAEESSHKFCSSCHGLLSLKNGVFIKSIIPDGAAHVDGRLQAGDEIIAVQGVCLYNGEEFTPPNNKVILGDVYDPIKFAQLQTKFQNRVYFNSNNTLNFASSSKPDPLALLKQILNHAQSAATSVNLIVLRRSLDQRSCSTNTLASVDANYCHNVTVAADVHIPSKTDDLKNEKLMTILKPTVLQMDNAPGISSNRERLERFEELRSRDHQQRYYRSDRQNSPENYAPDLICLQSEHDSDDPNQATCSENNSNHSTNNHSIADSNHVSSGFITDFEA